MRKRSVACAMALALVGGGSGLPIVLSQEGGTAKRSVYDRPRSSDAPRATVKAEPRPLPAAASSERPLTSPKRPRGYLSHGLQVPQAAAGRTTRQSMPPIGRSLGSAKSASSQQPVVPAFFPAPIGAAADPLPASASPATNSQQIALQLSSPAPGEHPLVPAVRWAKVCLKNLENIRDYSAKMAKRERIDGVLSDYEYLKIKVRHEPFSVYLSFIGPARVKGQEAIYVKGRNDGNLLGHANGMRKIFGTVSLKPDSMLAMAGNRYPITELGIKRLTERLIEVGEHDSKFGECEVKAVPNIKINGRDCVCLQVTHPIPRKDFIFYKAKIYLDSEHNVPVRYEAYDWPRESGGEPVLLEEYTYLELKLNNGFTDRDFDVANPEYQFR